MLAIVIIVLAVVLTASIVKTPRTGANLSRAGLLELQNLLEPERKIEIVREMDRKEDLLVSLDEHGGE